jgi:hypothetical protein
MSDSNFIRMGGMSWAEQNLVLSVLKATWLIDRTLALSNKSKGKAIAITAVFSNFGNWEILSKENVH